MIRGPGSREPIVVGLLATAGLPADLALDIGDELPEELSERLPVPAARLARKLAGHDRRGARPLRGESDFAVREVSYRYQPDEGDELD